jgi:hypothetical protein
VVRLAVALGAFALLTSAASAQTGPTRLRITVWPKGHEAAVVHRYTVACAPARGTVPHPLRACRLLSRLGADAFAPTRPGTFCSDIWGGPAEAWVRGSVAGRAVDARLSLVNGCELSRWNRVRAVVPR